MTDTDAQPVSPVETPHVLDSIQPDVWVNIPRCITEALQLIVSQIKSTQNQMLTINETITKSHDQLETEFKAFVQSSTISEREIAKLIDGFRDTLNRTLKNFSLEVSVISEMALDNQQKVQQLQDLTKNLKKGLGSLEDNGLQKIIKDITEELSLKFDVKEANLKDYVGNKVHEMVDIPGLVGPGKKFNNVKSLIKHLHDSYDSKADAITQVIDNREGFIKKALAEYDLPNKIKTVVHTEIRQHVMPEIEKMDMVLTKYEDQNKQSPNEKALLARINSLEQQSKALEAKLHRLEVFHETIASPRDTQGVEQSEENKEMIGSKDSIVDIEIRTRSKSDNREISRGLDHSKNKLSKNLLWKDESGSRLIEEEDEDVMSPQVKANKGVGFEPELVLEKGEKTGKESQLVSDILKDKSTPVGETPASMYSSTGNVSSSSQAHGGKSPMKAIIKSSLKPKPVKRSNTITLEGKESNNNTKSHFKSTKATDESFTTEGNTSLRKDESPHKRTKIPVFDPAKFELKQMGPHTYEFLSILEHEFDAIYSLLADLYHQNDHNKSPSHQNHRQTTAKPNTGRGVSIDREVPLPKTSPPKSTLAKVSAYQLLKALTKHGEDNAPPKDEGPSQQEILSRPPLIQIRPQGVRVAAVQGPGQGQQPHLPQLPQRNRMGSDQLAHDAKELMEAHGHGKMSPLRMRATHGNGKMWVAGQPAQGGSKDTSKLDSSFEVTKEILDNDKEDSVFVPYPVEKTMQEIPIVRQRAVTDKFRRDNGERVYS